MALKTRSLPLAALNKTLELDPQNVSANFNRGLIKEGMQDYENAILDYNKVITANPNDAVAYYNRATCKGGIDDYGAGVSDMDEAIKLDPKNASYYKQRGNFYYQLSQKDKACFDWRKAVEFGGCKSALPDR